MGPAVEFVCQRIVGTRRTLLKYWLASTRSDEALSRRHRACTRAASGVRGRRGSRYEFMNVSGCCIRLSTRARRADPCKQREKGWRR